MKSIDWLNLAKERIECVLHNYPDNTYLSDAIKFINASIKEANNIGENLGTSYNEVQINDHQKPWERGFK